MCLLPALAFSLANCKPERPAEDEATFGVPSTTLRLPKKPGWLRDPNLAPTSGRSGGTVLRLVRQGAVPGSPRIEVAVDRSGDGPAVLEDFLTRNLRDMGRLEAAGQIHILHVEQQRIALAALPAYRVRHEYTAGQGNTQVSLYQVSIFVVAEGIGITVTAAGRTELFHPLGRSIAEVLEGMTVGGKATPATPADAPIDLGKVGGASL
jgi:hypothetical protein